MALARAANEVEDGRSNTWLMVFCVYLFDELSPFSLVVAGQERLDRDSGLTDEDVRSMVSGLILKLIMAVVVGGDYGF